jgi:hypothetical protein
MFKKFVIVTIHHRHRPSDSTDVFALTLCVNVLDIFPKMDVRGFGS